MAAAESGRVRKQKNFSQDEQKQLCRSVLHVSQDLITRNGQRAVAFGKRSQITIRKIGLGDV